MDAKGRDGGGFAEWSRGCDGKGVLCGFWVPAYAGMTGVCRDDGRSREWRQWVLVWNSGIHCERRSACSRPLHVAKGREKEWSMGSGFARLRG